MKEIRVAKFNVVSFMCTMSMLISIPVCEVLISAGGTRAQLQKMRIYSNMGSHRPTLLPTFGPKVWVFQSFSKSDMNEIRIAKLTSCVPLWLFYFTSRACFCPNMIMIMCSLCTPF